MSKYQAVKDFMELFGQECPSAPVIPSPQVQGLRLKLHNDECFWELRAAFNVGDPIEVMDSICDSLYVIYGTAIACGFSEDQVDRAFEAVHHNNIAKFWTTLQVENAFGFPHYTLEHTTGANFEKLTAKRKDTKSLWIVTDEHGKVVKPMGYEKVDIKL